MGSSGRPKSPNDDWKNSELIVFVNNLEGVRLFSHAGCEKRDHRGYVRNKCHFSASVPDRLNSAACRFIVLSCRCTFHVPVAVDWFRSDGAGMQAKCPMCLTVVAVAPSAQLQSERSSASRGKSSSRRCILIRRLLRSLRLLAVLHAHHPLAVPSRRFQQGVPVLGKPSSVWQFHLAQLLRSVLLRSVLL